MQIRDIHRNQEEEEEEEEFIKKGRNRPHILIGGVLYTHVDHLFEPDFIKYFNLNCNQFVHCLDSVMNKVDILHDQCCTHDMFFTSLDDILFLPTNLYMVHKDSIPIVFDSVCSVALTSCKKDFQGTLVKIDNII